MKRIGGRREEEEEGSSQSMSGCCFSNRRASFCPEGKKFWLVCNWRAAVADGLSIGTVAVQRCISAVMQQYRQISDGAQLMPTYMTPYGELRR